MKPPGRNHPAGRDLPTRGHRGRGASTRSHDDASCSAKVEYLTSSTPAYTDRLDLHYSTNNAPTKTWGRARLRIADNPIYTHDWCAPTNSAPGPHSALRTTTTAPIIGAHPRTIDRGHTPHCGQLRLHQQWVPAHEPRSWRSRKSCHTRLPTWANSRRKRPARQRLRNPPPRTPHCGQQEPAPSLVCTHELQIGAILRNADNPRYTHHWCTPTNISEWHPHKPTIHQGKHGATCTTSAIALR